MIRLFAAIALPPELAGGLAAQKAGIPRARWVEARNLHITLRFIGEVDGGMAQEIHECLAEIRPAAFELTLEGFGTFGNRRLGSLWAGVAKSAELTHLQAKIDSALSRAGIQPEGRKFLPHVTLARLKDAPVARVQAFIAGHSPFRASFPVDHFTLFRSHLGRGGAEYQALAEYPLAVLE